MTVRTGASIYSWLFTLAGLVISLPVTTYGECDLTSAYFGFWLFYSWFGYPLFLLCALWEDVWEGGALPSYVALMFVNFAVFFLIALMTPVC